MHTRSGTQYHIWDPKSEMNPNISSIAKLLEYLSPPIWQYRARVEKHREHLDRLESGLPRMLARINLDLKIGHLDLMFILINGMNLWNIELEAPTFDGQFDPQLFLD